MEKIYEKIDQDNLKEIKTFEKFYDRESLESERARLLTELAYIDEMLAVLDESK